jgi:iron complex outermembrane receptor protein
MIPTVHAQNLSPDSILAMSPEELSGLRVTSVSKKPEPLAGVPASVYVITSDAIRRSGAMTLLEVLRLAPNLTVSTDNFMIGNVSARGHNGGYYATSTMMLVLIDGRSVYSPFFSGVFWDSLDVMMDDVERIEVISGPAGVLWGVNAVNGVINITTRSSSQTRGALASVNVGTHGNDVAFRYGAALGNGGSYRVHGKSTERGNTFNSTTGLALPDSGRRKQLGARADWERPDQKVSLQLNINDGEEGQPLPGSINIGAPGPLPAIVHSGFNGTARWTRLTADRGSLALQSYFSIDRRTMMPAIANDNRVIDFELQRNLPDHGAHRITWGANYRYSVDQVTNSALFGFLPERANQSWLSVFAQDEITLRPDLRLTVGSRIEHGAYGTTDVLPSARLAWTFRPDHLLWTGISRSARAPARLDAAVAFPIFNPFLLSGNPKPRSEIVDALEIGYRGQWANRSFSVTAFRNQYDHLSTVDPPDGTNWQVGNSGRSHATGLEMWGTWRVTPGWRLSGGATALTEQYRNRYGLQDSFIGNLAGNDPAYTAQVRSAWNLGSRTEFDIALRRVASLKFPDVPSYTALDARIGWRVDHNLEFSVSGHNLLGTAHEEIGVVPLRGKMPTQIFAKLVWRN